MWIRTHNSAGVALGSMFASVALVLSGCFVSESASFGMLSNRPIPRDVEILERGVTAELCPDDRFSLVDVAEVVDLAIQSRPDGNMLLNVRHWSWEAWSGRICIRVRGDLAKWR